MVDIPITQSDRAVTVSVVTPGQTDFDYDFYVQEAGDIQVTRIQIGGARTELVSGVDFNVTSFGDEAGGSIEIVGIVLSFGESLTIYSDIPIERPNDYTRDLFADQVNFELDRVFMILQEKARALALSIKYAIGQAIFPSGVVFMSDGLGGVLPGPDATDIALAQGYAAQAEEAADRAEDAAALAFNDTVVRAFTGDGGTTVFDLLISPGSVNNIDVFISGLHQEKATYNLVGTTVVFSQAPPAPDTPGDFNIAIEFGNALAVGVPGSRTVDFEILQAIATARLLGRKTAGTGSVEELTGADLRDFFFPAGSVIDTVEATPYSTATSISQIIPIDDTLPQIGEGVQILTATITPKNAANKIRATFTGGITGDAAAVVYPCVALFKTGSNDAFAADYMQLSAGTRTIAKIERSFVAGGTGAITVTARIGKNTASTNFWLNGGNTGVHALSTAMACTLVLEEIKG